MRVEYHMGTDFAFQPQLLAVGGQQQLNGGGEEADAVVNTLDAIFGIDTFQRHHRHQHMGVGYQPRIAGKQRLDVERARRFNHRIYPVAGNIDARYFVDDSVNLGDDNPLAEVGGFGDHRCIFGVKAGIQVTVFIRLECSDQRHPRGEIDKIAAEQLKIGMDRPELYLASLNQLCETAILWPGVGEVELLGNPFFE